MNADLQRELFEAPFTGLESSLKLYHFRHGANIRGLSGLGIVFAPKFKILRVDLFFLLFTGGYLLQPSP